MLKKRFRIKSKGLSIKDAIYHQTPVRDTTQSIQQELREFRQGQRLDPRMLQNLDELVRRYDLAPQDRTSLQLFLYRFNNARVVNAVCPFLTSQRIDRVTLYNRAMSHGLHAKIHQKFTGVCVKYGQGQDSFTAIYFASGAINCVGVKCLGTRGIGYVQSVLRQYAPILLGPQRAAACVYKTRRISNRVTALKVPSTISLERLDLLLTSPFWKDCKYVSEIFPGLIYRVAGSNARVLYFTTGSMICCGITSRHLQSQIAQNLVQKLACYLRAYKDSHTPLP